MLALPIRDDTVITRFPLVTYGLIGACVCTHLWLSGLPPSVAERVIFRYGMTPALLLGHAGHHVPSVPPVLTLFTSMFLHGGWMHLLGNMLYLWLFGRGVENAMGSVRFLVFYLTVGLCAAFTQALTQPFETVPMVGASGAIAGVLGSYLLFYPRANVSVFIWLLLFIRVVTVPAVILLGLWFLLQLLSGLGTGEMGAGVAFWAHVGGFLAGLFLTPIFRAGHPLLTPPRSAPFAVTRRTAGASFGRGSVPRAGWRRYR
jgi:membrane associated rhomboid family serine protease